MFKCYGVACQRNITFTCDAPHRVHALTNAEMGLPHGKPIFILNLHRVSNDNQSMRWGSSDSINLTKTWVIRPILVYFFLVFLPLRCLRVHQLHKGFT